MSSSEKSMRSIAIRLTEDEIAELESLRARLQTKAAKGVRVTQRMTILAALERLQLHLDKLDKDRERQR